MIKRIISTFLAVLMLLGSASLVISAAESEGTPASTTAYEYNTSKSAPTMDYMTGRSDYKNPESELVDTAEEKLEIMDLRLEQDGYRLYVDEYSGEVAVQHVDTGEVLFTNPYDVGANDALTEEEKAEYLSQFIIKYVDTSNSNTSGKYFSYQHAAMSGSLNIDTKNILPSQITTKYIKNGVRVEYSIGRVDTRYLVPERISKDKFEKEIKGIICGEESEASKYEKSLIENFFELRDLEAHVKKFEKNPEVAEQQKEDFLKKYPMTADGPVYIFTGVTKKEYKAIEGVIKKYCPDYTYEELDSEHLKLNYTPEDKNEALFKIALEYTIDADGLSVRLPASGIRFDESIYRLETIEILPFMGAAANPNSGYTFFPDGSGALFDFEELAARGGSTYFYGTVYGEDFAYYNIGTGAPHNEIVRYPVYGLTETSVDADGVENKRGFVAIVEEGDAMMTLCSFHSPEYNSVRMQVNPRPYDEYELSSAISVAGDSIWTVVSPRKYTGNFTIRYKMLTDHSDAGIENPKDHEKYYETSYVGMAKAYRDYLIAKEVLVPLVDSDVKDDIPLYIETFGAIETTEKFLSIPYNSMKPLTSFKDITKMYDELAENDVSNINFILTGYSKGGLNTDLVPTGIKWDRSVKKDMSFEDLLAYAKEKGFGLYPDFDFVFASDNKLFDGMRLKKHAVKTIDGRYTSKREYSATRQTYVSYYELAMSPAYFSDFYTKLSEDYTKYEPIGISVSSLGEYLTSDFDEKDPYHREDSKDFTIEAFAYLKNEYSKVMTSYGNAYSWKYVDYITDIATDSSRHARSAATVPFLGIVLHGYKQIAGEPINMEGNIDYAMLRAIENGASLKFILSYDNTEKLKENEQTSDYYSVRYDIWVSDLIARYNDINNALKDVQTSTIEGHKFIDGWRIPDETEIINDSADQLIASINKEIQSAADSKEELRLTLQNIRKYLYDCKENLALIADMSDTPNEKSVKALYESEAITLARKALFGEKPEEVEAGKEPEIGALADFEDKAAKLETAKKEFEADPNENTKKRLETRQSFYDEALDTFKKAYDQYKAEVAKALGDGVKYADMYKFAKDNFDKLAENEAYPTEIITELEGILTDFADEYAALEAYVSAKNKEVSENLVDMENTYKDILISTEDTENSESSSGFDKYAAAKNSIVFEKYSNEKGFILNFNNYAVKVYVGGTYYTIGAYDYIVIFGEEA
ncbi:MAG: hypothetical protein E7623_06170 [Ruminococcaceae bacterium]|nr:hypothetical protein [Oscillospiraceae bacterium]